MLLHGLDAIAPADQPSSWQLPSRAAQQPLLLASADVPARPTTGRRQQQHQGMIADSARFYSIINMRLHHRSGWYRQLPKRSPPLHLERPSGWTPAGSAQTAGTAPARAAESALAPAPEPQRQAPAYQARSSQGGKGRATISNFGCVPKNVGRTGLRTFKEQQCRHTHLKEVYFLQPPMWHLRKAASVTAT